MTEETPPTLEKPVEQPRPPEPARPPEILAEGAHEGWFHRDNATTAIILQPQGDVEVL
jgi:hypothetical protein